jgi:hypothetical protein
VIAPIGGAGVGVGVGIGGSVCGRFCDDPGGRDAETVGVGVGVGTALGSVAGAVVGPGVALGAAVAAPGATLDGIGGDVADPAHPAISIKVVTTTNNRRIIGTPK